MRIRYRLLIIAGILVALSLIIYYVININKVYSDASSYYSPEYTNCHSDDGLYFVKDFNYIYYVDHKSGEKVPICRKTNCLHNSTQCNAYFEADLPPGIMTYNDRLYIVTHYQEYKYDEPGEYYMGKGYCRLYETDKDGGEKRLIFESGSGGIQSLLAVGDRIYISYTKNRKETNSKGEIMSDAFLCSYSLRWRSTTDLCSLTESEVIRNPYIRLIGNTGDRVVFSVAYEESDGGYQCKLNEIKEDNISEIRPYHKMDSPIYPAFMNTNRIYMIDEETGGGKSLVILDNSLQVEKRLLTVDDMKTSIIQVGDEYVIAVDSDYKKCLYDYMTNELYVANTCFQDGGKYISDIIDIDCVNDVIYIDQHDYTGMKPGEVYYTDMSDYGCVNLTKFLNEYFKSYNELSVDEMKELNWIHKYDK